MNTPLLLMRRLLCLGAGAGALMLLPSCLHVSSEPIEVKPIHIVADINLRIDRQLDDFFSFEDKYPPGSAATQASTTQPAEPQPTRLPQPM
ncbi:MAG TPA: hypothetical protein VH518_20900 [Tepidisphaeraceae bacterium]